MKQRVFRSKKPNKPHLLRKRRNGSDGSGVLICIAVASILGGLIAILKPIPFQSIGGLAGRRYRMNEVISSYSINETVGFGVLFVAIGIFLIRIALEIRKPK